MRGTLGKISLHLLPAPLWTMELQSGRPHSTYLPSRLRLSIEANEEPRGNTLVRGPINRTVWILGNSNYAHEAEGARGGPSSLIGG
jgi:hypothetical protein